MIIEFLGTPGAGKSTLLAVAADCLTERGYCARSVVDAARPVAARTLVGRPIARLAPTRWRRPLLWQLFYAATEAERTRFFIRHPGFMWQVWRYQIGRPLSGSDRHHVLRWFNHQTGVYEFLRRRAVPSEVFLFDEGFIHRVVQLFASEHEEPDARVVQAYVARLPRPDLVIFPTAPLEICLRRVYDRGLWRRFAAKTNDETARFMAAAARTVTIAAAAAREQGWPVIEVDNGGDPAAAAACLRRALAEVVSPFTFTTQSRAIQAMIER